MIEYIHSSAMNSTMLTPMHGTECKGLGKILGLVVGVAAAIAVPFLAPAIGGILGGGFFASIAGQALIGAGIGALGGAAGAALSGGDILKGALLGGAGGAITGGIGAWMGGASLTAGAPVAGAPAAGTGAAAGTVIDPVTGFETTAGATTGLVGATAGAGALAASAGALSPALATAGAAPAATGIAGVVGSTGFKTAAIQTLLQGGTQMLQTLQPNQQAELFRQMQAEMQVTRTQDAAAYAAQKKIFDEYYNFAKGINPTFFAEMERANSMQRMSTTWADTERTMREGGASKEAIAGERRRQEVGGAAGLNTSYAGGFMRGLDAQGSAMRTASSLYPKTDPSYLQNLNYLRTAAGEAEDDRAAGIAGLTAPWAVYAKGLTNSNINTHPIYG